MAVFYTNGGVGAMLASNTSSRCPQRWQRYKPELVAERHDLITQIEHHSEVESW
jgi:hypothetical protein